MQPLRTEVERSSRWYLESKVGGVRQLRRIPLHPLPFRVGRLVRLPLALGSDSVSKEHAELQLEEGALVVRDLDSRNGTFVNDIRVERATLREGDILRFADVEFLVACEELRREQGEVGDAAIEPATVQLSDISLPQQFVGGAGQMPELLRDRRATVLFQPVIALQSGMPAGYEALGRGLHPQLPDSPSGLFRVAEAIGAQRELSRLFREKALEQAASRRRLGMLFINVHPAEVEDERLVEDLLEARRAHPHLQLTIEIHDSALEDLSAIERLRSRLSGAGVGLAYDSFGAGQARLLELAEVPPHYLKFDPAFVLGIDKAPQSRQQLLTSLVSVAHELQTHTVAVGIETAEEAAVCRRIGFTHAQGFFFGSPKTIDEL